MTTEIATLADAFVLFSDKDEIRLKLSDMPNTFAYVTSELLSNGYSKVAFTLDELAMKMYEYANFKGRVKL